MFYVISRKPEGVWKAHDKMYETYVEAKREVDIWKEFDETHNERHEYLVIEIEEVKR